MKFLALAWTVTHPDRQTNMNEIIFYLHKRMVKKQLYLPLRDIEFCILGSFMCVCISFSSKINLRKMRLYWLYLHRKDMSSMSYLLSVPIVIANKHSVERLIPGLSDILASFLLVLFFCVCLSVCLLLVCYLHLCSSHTPILCYSVFHSL